MPSILNNSTGKQLLFADHATDFGASPATAANSLIIGTPIDVQIDLTGVVVDAGRASAKFDFGIDRPPLYRLDACIEHAAAQSDGFSVDFWYAGSPSSVAGTGNPAGLTGADEAFTYTRGKDGQLISIGSLQLVASAINIGFVGFVRPTHRYGMIVLRNKGSGAMGSIMDETHFTLTPIEYDQGA